MKCPRCDTVNPEKTKYCGECGTNLTTPLEHDLSLTRTLEPPDESIPLRKIKIAGRYKIIECLGTGGMGDVYKAYDKQLKDEVALKFIRPEIAANRKTLDRFSNELRIARKIVHQNVGRMYELMEEDGAFFITMEYIPGQDLKGLIRQSRQLTLSTTITIAKQICEGLIEAHRLGVVHRDLKPSNIMIDKRGNARIMDFGVARSLEGGETIKEKKVIGTPAYISPEQAKGEEVDQRSDIYSLGIIIFEMLTGERPFHGETKEDYVDLHLHKEPPRLSELRPQVPPFMESIVQKCLVKDRNKRYQNVEELLEDLETHEEETQTYVLRPQRKKSVWKYPLIVPVVLLVLIGLYVILGPREPIVSYAPEGTKTPLLVMLFNNNSGDNSLDHWQRALSDGIIHALLPSQNIRVRTGDTRFSILSSLDLLGVGEYSLQNFVDMATRGESDYILYGDFTKAEDTYSIQAVLKNVATGKSIASDSIRGNDATVFLAAIDRISRWAAAELKPRGEAAVADSVQDIESTLTGSPEALKLYTLGIQYYREGRIKESNEILLEAVEIDPGFALAHKRISENYHYLGDLDKSKSSALKALDLVENKSDRAQYLVQGWVYTILEESYAKAIAAYQKLLESYPDDEEGNTYLGANYRNMEEWDLCIERYSHILEISPSILKEQNSIAVENIVMCYQAKGMYKEALAFSREHRPNFANEHDYYFYLGVSHLCQRKFTLALHEFNEALALAPGHASIIAMTGHVYHAQDNFRTAEAYYRQLLDSDDVEARLRGRYWLANLGLAQGQYEKCAEHISLGLEEAEKSDLRIQRIDFYHLKAYLSLQLGDFEKGLQASAEADKLASEIVIKRENILALHLRGLLLLKQNKLDEATKTAGDLLSKIEDSQVKKLERYYYHLKGAIAESEGLFSQAKDYFESALSLLPAQYGPLDKHALFYYPLAMAYYVEGQIDKAQEQLQQLTELTAGRLHHGDLYAKSYYWLGKICQEKGERQEALNHYRKFLRLWPDADPGIAEVRDANAQLSLLTE